jgi:hypothetical protein
MRSRKVHKLAFIHYHKSNSEYSKKVENSEDKI